MFTSPHPRPRLWLGRFLSLAILVSLGASLPTYPTQAQEDDVRTRQRVAELNDVGLARWRAGDSPGAVASLTEAIDLMPDWWGAYNHRALARATAGDHEGALADAESAVRLLGSGPITVDLWAAVLDTRGFAHLLLGQHEAALRDYDEVIATNVGTHVAFPLGRGLARIGLGDQMGGLADLKWGFLIAGAFPSDPQLRVLFTHAERALVSVMLPFEPDAFEPDDATEQATPITMDGRTYLHSLHGGGDVDRVSFHLAVGQGLRLHARSADCDTYLTLHGPDEAIIREDDDGGPNGLDSMVIYAATESGMHVASIRHFFAEHGTCASYELTGLATPTR